MQKLIKHHKNCLRSNLLNESLHLLITLTCCSNCVMSIAKLNHSLLKSYLSYQQKAEKYNY